MSSSFGTTEIRINLPTDGRGNYLFDQATAWPYGDEPMGLGGVWFTATIQGEDPFEPAELEGRVAELEQKVDESGRHIKELFRRQLYLMDQISDTNA